MECGAIYPATGADDWLCTSRGSPPGTPDRRASAPCSANPSPAVGRACLTSPGWLRRTFRAKSHLWKYK